MEYMSQEGYDKLVAELKELEAQVPKVKDAIAEARAMGDLSENFEYHAAKREQSRLLGTIRFKQNILAHARVLDHSSHPSDTIQLLTRWSLPIWGISQKWLILSSALTRPTSRKGRFL